MGMGYELQCARCGHTEDILCGSGMSYPTVYQETLERARSGAYGLEWRQLLEGDDRLVIDAEQVVYLCPGCGSFKVEPKLTIYTPVNDEVKPHEHFWPASEDAENYKAYKAYPHRCDVCGTRMRQVKDNEITDGVLPCPECGEPLLPFSFICWD